MAAVLPCPTIGLKSDSNMLEVMVAELNNNEHGYCNSMPTDSSNRTVQQIADRETSSVVEEVIIGRTEEKQKILSILSESITEKMIILPIYGIGGIGKTTLAQLIFNDPQFQDYTRVWIYVSQEFNLNKIGNSIITQLTDKISNIPTKQMLHKCLEELFASRSILVVVDDLWEENPKEFHKLKVMLGLGLGSKVIIVTTRDGGLARKICSPAVTPYKLETLRVDECWTIIKQKADFEGRVDQEQLEHIGREIATKCGGVPLAAQSLGYMLNGMTSDDWESVRDSYIWNLSTSEGHEVLASLLLSYSQMSAWLKLCFSYCAIFPKGYIIVKYDLIYQWIALGFIKQSRIFDFMQLSENYVTQLLGMSFLQYSKRPLRGRNQEKDGTLFTMHDLVHDLAKEILSHQLNTGGNKCRYALLTDCSKSLQLFVNFPANIKALRFQDCGGQELCGSAFSSAKCLSVLDLSECFINELPDCIGQLKQLRFLRAPDIRLEIPNCITELSELNYLNLRGSSEISALPVSIGDMKGLMHLDLSGCNRISKLPISFSELKQLVHLDLSNCNMFLAETLGGCTKLQYLNLSVLNSTGHKRITGLPEVIGNLIKLRYLNLSRCVDLMGPWPPEAEEIHKLLCSISTLSNLEHLDLSRNNQISSIPESIGKLTKLHTLDLSICCNIKKLPDSIFKMVRLKVLSWIYWPNRLSESALPRFNFVSLPHFEVQSSNDKCSSNISLLQPTNPDQLDIGKLENVKSAEEATSVKLIDKQAIRTLKFQWTLGAERFVDDKVVLEKLVPPSSVEILTIVGYRSHNIPDWFMGIRQYLPNLLALTLCDFPNCNNLLPPLGLLPNLLNLILDRMEGLEEWNTTHYSGKEGSNEPMFPKLEELKIKQCPKLRISLPRARRLWIQDSDNILSSWGEGSTHIGDSFSSLMHIIKGRELLVSGSKVPMHQWRLLYHLPAFRTLKIMDCTDLSTSPDMTQHLSSIDLQCLRLSSLDQAELPNWLAKLTSLHELTLDRCESMTSLPQWLGEVTSLKKMEVIFCPKLEKWLKSKENKRFIAHIDITVTRSPYQLLFLGEASDESNEEDIAETNEETTYSLHTATGSQRPIDDGVSNPSSPPPTRMADTIPQSRAAALTPETPRHLHPSPAAHNTMPSTNIAATMVAPISDDDADNMSIICIGDDDKLTVSATARPARPTPCTPLGLLMVSPLATSLVGDGAEGVLPRPGYTLTNATYNADDEGPQLDSSSGSWASLQRARKGKGKQSDTDLVDPVDVPIISKKMRSLLELQELDVEAGSTGTAVSASSPAVLSLGLNAAVSASVKPRCYRRSPEREQEDDAACGERPPEQTKDPEKRNNSGTEEEGDRFSFRFLLDAFLAVVACFCSPQSRH
ncbi:uncharacterized protein [Aegilops tauschii subsp. strangulata]